jgi:hypothetical protein
LSRANGPQTCYCVTMDDGRPSFHDREGADLDAEGFRRILTPPVSAVGTVYRATSGEVWGTLSCTPGLAVCAWRVAGADRAGGSSDTRGRAAWQLVRHVEGLRRETSWPLSRPLELLTPDQFLRLVDLAGRLPEAQTRLARMREFAARRWPGRTELLTAAPQLPLLFEMARCAT